VHLTKSTKNPCVVQGGNYVGTNTVGVSLPLHLRTEADPVSETSCYLLILDFRTMDKVQKPVSSQCYIPSSEPFRIYTAESSHSCN
jgi:hypothetical protein